MFTQILALRDLHFSILCFTFATDCVIKRKMKENEDITKYVIREIDPPIFIHPYIGHDIVDMTIEEIKSKLPDDEQK